MPRAFDASKNAACAALTGDSPAALGATVLCVALRARGKESESDRIHRMIERFYGEPYEQLVKDKILTPIGMNSTTITLSPTQFGNAVKGYDGNGVAMPDQVAGLQGAAAFRSNVTDMLKYAVWQISESDPAVKLSHQAYAVAGNYAAGLNWQMLSAPGKRLIWQTGHLDGFHSFLVVEPELKIGLVALFNETDGKSNATHDALINGILKTLNADAILMP